MTSFDQHAMHRAAVRVLRTDFAAGSLYFLLTLVACRVERDPESGADIASMPHYHVDAQTEVLEGEQGRFSADS